LRLVISSCFNMASSFLPIVLSIAVLLSCSLESSASVSAKSFVLGEAQDQLYLSYSAYCGDNVNANWNCYWCNSISGITWLGNFGNSGGAIFGYIAIGDGFVEVVFRGTDNLAGWISNADFKLVPYKNVPNALVHQGFNQIYSNVSADIHSYVSDALNTCGSACNGTVIVTGHSLGAALATLGAIDIKEWNPNVDVLLYNFGSPRVGNSVLAGYIESVLTSTYRMTNKADIVPHVPPKLFNYHHISEEIWYHGGQYHFCDMSGEDPNCADSQKLPNVWDHATYMNIDILDGIIHGCLYTDPAKLGKIPTNL